MGHLGGAAEATDEQMDIAAALSPVFESTYFTFFFSRIKKRVLRFLEMTCQKKRRICKQSEYR